MALPTFKTKRLVLEPLQLKHASSYQKNFVDYEVVKMLSDKVPWPYPENGVYDFIKDLILPRQGKDKWCWAILQKDQPEEAIGCVDLWRDGTPEHRGFWLARKHLGKGYMTEAVHPIMDYAFDVLGFEELLFSNAVGNIGSRRVKQKTGAKFLRTIQTKHVDPDVNESEIWSLSKAEWKKSKTTSIG